jgi:two-component system CheB/CheR fusion protein
VVRMAREGLAAPLRTALAQAMKTDRPVTREGILYEMEGHPTDLTIEVHPFRPNAFSERFFLVLFKENAIPIHPPVKEARGRAGKGGAKGKAGGAAELDTQRLKTELESTRASLQAIIEEQEGTNEELKCANEEIQSSNEELHSINEELQTAKEELQSTNEELTSINEQLQRRNEELTESNNDLNNLLSSFQMPILMLGNDLVIRRFTSLAERFFHLIPSDVGRPLSDIRARFESPNLLKMIQAVVETLEIQDQEIQDSEGHWYLMRVRPYRTSDNKIDGAIVLFVSVDELRRALMDATTIVDQPVAILSSEFNIIQANPAFLESFKLTAEGTTGVSIFELEEGHWRIPGLRRLLEQAREEGAKSAEAKIEHDFPATGRRKLLLKACRLYQQKGPGQVVLALREITEAS